MKLNKIILSLVSLILFAVGCSDDPTSEDEALDSPSVDSKELSIISLNPSATEIIVEIGAAESLVAVDQSSDYPMEELPDNKELDAFNPDLEKIIELEPDLVVLGLDNPEIVSALKNQDIEVIVQPVASSLDDMYSNIEQLGELTDRSDASAQLVAELRESVESYSVSTDDLVIYHEVGSDQGAYYLEYEETLVGDFYKTIGLDNIASVEDLNSNAISAEQIIAQDPDLIIVSVYGEDEQEAVDKIKNRTGWGQISAIEKDQVFSVDGNLSSRSGPRFIDFVDQISDITAALSP